MSLSLLVLNHQSAVPPYEQIRVQVRTLIASGQLGPGAGLPSVRQLADDLDVAPNTVVRAYKELERDGWVVTSARKGVMVTSQLPSATVEERQHRLADAVAELLVTVHQLDVTAEEVCAEINRQFSR